MNEKHIIADREIVLSKMSIEQKITYGILCVKTVCDDFTWNKWADDWLSGKDRLEDSAYAMHEVCADICNASHHRNNTISRYWPMRAAAHTAYAASMSEWPDDAIHKVDLEIYIERAVSSVKISRQGDY